MSSRISAGILLYRHPQGPLEVLLGHPGGPYFARKDAGHWTIPKGEVEADESPEGSPAADPAGSASDARPGPFRDPREADLEQLLAVARREFAEETGHQVPDGRPATLGSIVQKGGKVVVAWALEGDLDPARAHSNTFELEWPPGSGRTVAVPEIDRVEWFGSAEARRRIKPTQIPLLDRLEELLATEAINTP